jgi:Flp pilus assembly protein TadD
VAGRSNAAQDRQSPAPRGSSSADLPLASRSDESAAKLQRVVALFGQKEFAQAEQLCRELLDENRNDPDALHLMGVMRHYLGDDKAAEVLIGRAITLVPDFVPYYANLAAIYRAIGREQDAGRLEERMAAIERAKGQPQPVLH